MDMSTGAQQARKPNGCEPDQEREIVAAACPVCGFTVFADNAVQTGDGWRHPSCARSKS
jgi:hypothetical protein